MDPSSYVPLYLESCYAAEHPDLTEAARSLVREQIANDPNRYATTPHAQALVSYMHVHQALLDGMGRMDDLPDEEFEQRRNELFEQAREQLKAICAADELCVDAHLVAIQLAEIPLESCLTSMIELEQRVRTHLASVYPAFDPEAEEFGGAWKFSVRGDDSVDTDSPARDPEVIGWLHAMEAIAQGCIFTARYRAAAQYARTVMRAPGFESIAVGTLLLALARLEDEEGFFEAVRAGGDDVENLPWFMLSRALLFYKLGQRRSARRALRDFCTRCDGGAYFLLNPTYHDPYLPVRPKPREAWNLTHQAVWEADGIISDTPDFALWAESVEGVREAAEDFAIRHGF